jgi:hypothetical protein
MYVLRKLLPQVVLLRDWRAPVLKEGGVYVQTIAHLAAGQTAWRAFPGRRHV